MDDKENGVAALTETTAPAAAGGFGVGLLLGITIGVVGSIAVAYGLDSEGQRQRTLRRRREAGYSY